MATSVWKGYLTFGLISIPIRLFSAARTERIGLNQLHSVCKTRIRMPLFARSASARCRAMKSSRATNTRKINTFSLTKKSSTRSSRNRPAAMEILEFVKGR